MATAEQLQPTTPDVSGRAIASILALTFGLAWLVCLPLWLSPRHLTSPWMMPSEILMMWTPAVSTLLAVRFVVRHPHPLRLLGVPVPGSHSHPGSRSPCSPGLN